MVACLEGQKKARVALRESLGIVAGERAFFVDDVHHGPGQREQRKTRVRQSEIVQAAQRMAFRAFLVQQHAKPHPGIGQQGQASIGNAHHQGWRAIMARDDSLIGEQDFRSRLRKANEQKTSHDRGEDHAADNFNRRNSVAIERRRSHGSVTHGRQRLDAEEECVGERARPHIGNATWRREIEQGEDDIDPEFQTGEGERKFLPAQFERDMIGIAECVARGAALDEFNPAGSDTHRRIAFLALFSLGHDAFQAGDLRVARQQHPFPARAAVAGSLFAAASIAPKCFT